MPRKIIHCDADCFYAAIEMRDAPELRNRPMAVGGQSDRRGVISTCNYEARKYGVHSAMATAQARRLCPDLVIVKGNMAKYREASQVMRETFLEYTELIEPLSLDEAYLDVTHCQQLHGSATLIAEEIRKKIFDRLAITVSAGVAPVKFLAKVASDWNKPDGLFVIPPQQVDAFVRKLPVNKIHGVGKVTHQKLNKHGIYTCDDIRNYGQEELTKRFGRFGLRLYELSRGNDNREVKPERIRKSLSVERTFMEDLCTPTNCHEKLPELIEEIHTRTAKLNDKYQINKAFVKVKFADFTTTTLERAGTKACYDDYKCMISEAVLRKAKPIRLLGIGVRFKNLPQTTLGQQLELFPISDGEPVANSI